MRFTLAHGTGNDFVVLDDLEDGLDLSADLVRALCDRRTGVGADGVLRLGGPRDGAAVFMDYRNADGAPAEMCGNGVRVVVKHVLDHDLVRTDGERVAVATRAGVRDCVAHRGDDGRVVAVTVDMGPPRFDPAEVPFASTAPDAASETIDVDGTAVTLSALSMGNPHAVIVVDDVEDAPVATLGPRLETDERFPKGVNVEFVQPAGRDAARMRVWERGVGETASCGTGICAAAVALARRDLADRRMAVTVPGGRVEVDWTDEGTVLMTGPAVEVAHGELDDAWLAAIGPGA